MKLGLGCLDFMESTESFMMKGKKHRKIKSSYFFHCIFRHFATYFADFKGIIFAYFAGPAFWGLINPEWSLCNKGRRQSPVNLEPQRLLFDPNLRPLHIDKHRVSHVNQLSSRNL